MEDESPLYVFDVDRTLHDYANLDESMALMPGAADVLQQYSERGEVHVWSAGGEEYARNFIARHALGRFVTAYHGKMDPPVTESGALAILGRRATLQFDDDDTEQIPGWPFVFVPLSAAEIKLRKELGISLDEPL